MSYKGIDVVKRYGLNLNGNVYPVLGETYSIKEQLKMCGAQYHETLRWFFTEEEGATACGYPYCTIPVKDIVRQVIGSKRYDFIYMDVIQDMVRKLEPKREEEMEPKPSTSAHIGTIGNAIATSITIKRHYRFKSAYGPVSMLVMEDEFGNEYTWTTSKSLSDDFPNKQALITGTIKDHRVYEGIKQTVLTRCQLSFT